MTTQKSGKSKAAKPSVKVADMETKGQKETAANEEGQTNPKGGAGRYNFYEAWPSKWKG